MSARTRVVTKVYLYTVTPFNKIRIQDMEDVINLSHYVSNVILLSVSK